MAKLEGIPANASPEQIRAWGGLFAQLERAERVGIGGWLLLTVLVLLVFRCNDVTLWPMPPPAPCPEASP